MFVSPVFVHSVEFALNCCTYIIVELMLNCQWAKLQDLVSLLQFL